MQTAAACFAPRTSPARSGKHFISGSGFLYWDWKEQKLLLHHFPCLVHPGALLAQDALQDMLFCWELQAMLQGGGKGLIHTKAVPGADCGNGWPGVQEQLRWWLLLPCAHRPVLYSCSISVGSSRETGLREQN